MLLLGLLVLQSFGGPPILSAILGPPSTALLGVYRSIWTALGA